MKQGQNKEVFFGKRHLDLHVNALWYCILLFIGISSGTYAQTSQQLPTGTRENYTVYLDLSISDEFNASSLDLNKWRRRNTGGYVIEDFVNDLSLVQMESRLQTDGQSIKYISMKGIGEDSLIRTAGIVTRASGYYGFYVVRFRYRGFDNETSRKFGNIWHPAVWSARGNYTENENRFVSDDDFWLEIDFMEWEGKLWSSDAPARIIDSEGVRRKVVTKGEGQEKAVMRKEVAILDSTWQTIGLEYSPEHLKLWEWKGEEWIHMGERVVYFVEDDLNVPESKYTLSTVGRKARTPGFWYLGNIVGRYLYPSIEDGSTKRDMSNVSVDFDFFRYYRHVDAIDMDWPWENMCPEGNSEIVKDPSANASESRSISCKN